MARLLGVGADVGVMGEAVGIEVGEVVGLREGAMVALVGVEVGEPVGADDAIPTGAFEGKEDGAVLPLTVGLSDGAWLGSALGEALSATIGALVGVREGDLDGLLEGERVGSSVGARDRVGSAVPSPNVGNLVGLTVGESVGIRVLGGMGDFVGTPDGETDSLVVGDGVEPDDGEEVGEAGSPGVEVGRRVGFFVGIGVPFWAREGAAVRNGAIVGPRVGVLAGAAEGRSVGILILENSGTIISSRSSSSGSIFAFFPCFGALEAFGALVAFGEPEASFAASIKFSSKSI